MPGPRRLVFLLGRRRPVAGSVLMRGPQLHSLVAPHLPPGLVATVGILPGPRLPLLQALWARAQPEGAVFFVTKHAIRRLLPETATILRRKGGRLCFDHVDSDPTLAPVAPDAHVAASHAQADSLRALQQDGSLAPAPVVTLLHNGDARLYGQPAPPLRPRLRTVYFGLATLTRIPPALASEITIFDAAGLDPGPDALDGLRPFALHYGVRNDRAAPSRIIKPFTKGVTAALCGAAILTGRDTPDAAALLGPDYPYLSGPTDDGITETFHRARQDFGGPDWARALAAMQALAALVSPQALALQLCRLVAEVEG